MQGQYKRKLEKSPQLSKLQLRDTSLNETPQTEVSTALWPSAKLDAHVPKSYSTSHIFDKDITINKTNTAKNIKHLRSLKIINIKLGEITMILMII